MSANIVIYTDPRSLEHDKTVGVFRDLGLPNVEKDCEMSQQLVAIKRNQFDLEEPETPVRALLNSEGFAFGFMESRCLVDPSKSFGTNQSEAVA